jgi:hypothetical protein
MPNGVRPQKSAYRSSCSEWEKQKFDRYGPIYIYFLDVYIHADTGVLYTNTYIWIGRRSIGMNIFLPVFIASDTIQYLCTKKYI